MATEIWVNIGSGNGLVPDSTKPLPEPMLTNHQWSPVTFRSGQFHKRCLNHQSNPFENYMSKISFNFPRGQWVNYIVDKTSVPEAEHQSEFELTKAAPSRLHWQVVGCLFWWFGRKLPFCITMLCIHELAWLVNSLAPGRFEKKFYLSKLKLIFVIDSWGISCKVALR